jgi:xylan 1,4-beta-xylosidase
MVNTKHFMNTISFSCNTRAGAQPFPHFWEHTVGSCHAAMALRADWQRQLKQCHDELGFQHVRFHGLLSDDMGTLNNQDETLIYSFFNADQICDFLLSIGMRPFVELSFMPLTLSSGPDIVFHYKANITPPRDLHAWEVLISKLVTHWVQRYGVDEVSKWFFEVWNEPNLPAFWTGTQDDYFHLYERTAHAIKNVNKGLKVGGPATAANAWIPEFTAFCDRWKVPCDFISTHHYPTDAFGKPGDDTIAQLTQSRRSVLREQVALTKEQAGGRPVYYTEWSTSSNPFDMLHDLSYAAAYITKTVLEAQGYVEGYSYWTFSDIFEENYFNSVPFHGGFGLLNIYGIPKPAYRAFELLHKLGEERLDVSGSHATVDSWAFRKGNSIQVMLVQSVLPGHDAAVENVEVNLAFNGNITGAYVERIDDYHANATQAWIELNSPQSLKPEQVAQLQDASKLIREPLDFVSDNGSVRFSIAIPPQGVACITLETITA